MSAYDLLGLRDGALISFLRKMVEVCQVISEEVNQGLVMTLVAAVAVAVAVGGHPHHLNAGGPERVE